MAGALATPYGSFHHAMCIACAGYFVSLVFPLYVNTISKGHMDLHRATDVNIEEGRTVGVKKLQMESARCVLGMTIERRPL